LSIDNSSARVIADSKSMIASPQYACRMIHTLAGNSRAALPVRCSEMLTACLFRRRFRWLPENPHELCMVGGEVSFLPGRIQRSS